MTTRAVFAVIDHFSLAESAVRDLRSAGFESRDIIARFPDQVTTLDFALAKNTRAPYGALSRMGFSDDDAQSCDAAVRDGNILIAVSAAPGGEVRRALEVFQLLGITEVGVTAETTVPWAIGRPPLPGPQASSPPPRASSPPPLPSHP